MTPRWSAWATGQLDAVRAAGRWRAPRDLDADGPTGRTIDGRAVVSFASNDYLGLTRHPAVVAAAHAAIDRWGTGSGSARLLVGSRPCHSDLERELADWKGAEAAVLFPTGYATNVGVLSALASTDTLVVSDELNHASIIDGCRLSGAEVRVFRHADAEHAADLLADWSGRAIVVSDAVFSMDGDEAPVSALAAVSAERGALLVLDEAHTVLGGTHDLGGTEAIRVGTLSKTLGSLGGFAAGPAPLVDLIVNRARSYIFTTASTPADVEAARAALSIVRSTEGERLRRQLRHLVDLLVPGHPSPIVPILIGDETAAVAASAALLERGLLVPAVRPPTVAPGTSRLRVALSAAHTPDQVGALADALTDCVPAWRCR